MIIGKHLIAGEWLGSESTFRSEPHRGTGREYAQGRVSDINRAAELATEAFKSYSRTHAGTRSELLEKIASEIEAHRLEIIQICCDESGLTQERVTGEFNRTVAQLQYFAKTLLQGAYLDLRHEKALPDRIPHTLVLLIVWRSVLTGHSNKPGSTLGFSRRFRVILSMPDKLWYSIRQ